MPVLESEIEGKCVEKVLKELGIFSIKLEKTQESGYPDRVFLLKMGVALFIEFKREGEETTTRQKLIHERLKHHGFPTHVAYSVEEGFRLVETWKKRVEAAPVPKARRKVDDRKKSRRAVPRSRAR